MIKFFLYILIIIPFNSLAQEINQSYLDSLPDDIKNDVILRIDEKNKYEKNVYRSIDNSSDLKKDLATISADDIFGSNFFDSVQSSFMPINAPNIDDSYVLDFGDVLGIQFIGQKSSIDTYPLARDGSINILDIGKIFVAGQTLDKASKLIDSKVTQAFIGTEVYVTLNNIRDVSVLISGGAFNPGVYTLSGNSNVLHALNVAGGIGPQGSYRSIKLIRDNEVIDTLDIYDILLDGYFNSRTRLRNGDIIFVDPRANLITMEGSFKRLAKYELKEGQMLSEAINYANGISTDSDLSNIFLYRLLDGEVKTIPISNVSQFKKIKANDMDRVFIRKHSFRDVSIDGAVLRPGNYKMIEGENIFDLIEKAGGYSSNAFPAGAVYLNKDAELININASKLLYESFIDGLLDVLQKGYSGDSDYSALINIAKELKNSEPNGRVIIDLLDDSSPTLLKNKDSLFIPEKSNSIFIFGEVLNEGPLLFKDGADIKHYLNEASGLKDTADKGSIFILYANGTTKNFSTNRNLFASQSEQIIVEPGSVIYVPRKIDKSVSNRLTAQAYATILGNIGVTLASLSVLNDK